jgi:hypothetical protein
MLQSGKNKKITLGKWWLKQIIEQNKPHHPTFDVAKM